MAQKSEDLVKFEEALKQLEKIVEKLEGGDTSLEESLKLFEEGKRLSSQCMKQLTEIEKKVQKIIEDERGKVHLEDFAPEAEEEEE
jgi:exodeoxyribonuclease VII small subunit